VPRPTPPAAPVRPGEPAPPAELTPEQDASLLQGFLPKEDLGILQFLQEHPKADGRGIVVAILDTGVDLAHVALQKTSTGAPKIIDVYDGTDDGYLPLPVIATTSAASLFGLSGRTLKLPADVSSGTEIRLGVIVDREFFPAGLAGRRVAERKDAWRREKERWEASVTDSSGERTDAIRAAFESLTNGDGDPGDRFDVAAIRRGNVWEVRIDTDADGDLAEETALHPFREAQEIAFFPDPAHLAVAVERIAPDASSIFLFFDEGGHGSHVAGIVGGFYGPDDPLNGLAPGCQFIAAKVGNGRMGGATSHNSISKCAQWAVDHGADVINISFGGSSFFEDGGEDGARFLDELVEKTGVIVCTSAGNSGPALSTIGGPGTAKRIFSWGAAISKKTQQTNYSTLEPRRDDMFQFSSRGPLLDGDPGIDFISPGAALSTLPSWMLVKSESWNGTSMASPQGAGFCAVVLSACRQEGIPVTPDRLRRAMRAGARRLEGIPVIEQGGGMPQASPTVEACARLAAAYPTKAVIGRTPHDRDAARPVVGYVVSVANATGIGGGYYERDLREEAPYRVAFGVRPDFPRDSLQSVRGEFLRIVKLVSEVAWMEPPPQVSIASSGASIPVRIDPSLLQPGLNVGRVIAKDVMHPEAGIEFELVATVIKPGEVDARNPLAEGALDFARGDRRSVYLRVPEGATVARLTVRETLANPANAYEIALAAQDLVRPPGERMSERRFYLAAEQEGHLEVGVLPRDVLELAVFSRWHDNRPGRLEYRIEFAGIGVAGEPPLRVEPERPGTGVVLMAPTWSSSISLEASLDREIEPLDVEWCVRPDTLVDFSLNGIPSMVDEGTAYFSANEGEAVELDLQVPPELDDLLGDSIYRVFDDSGVVVAKGYFYIPTVSFTIPRAGTYRILFSIYARGRRMFDYGRPIVNPLRVSSVGPFNANVFRDAVNGFIKGPDSLRTIALAGGEKRRLYLRFEDLDEDRVMRGTLRIRQPDGATLANVPIVADTRPREESADHALEEIVEGALSKARLLAARSDVSKELREEALAALDRAEALRSASPRSGGEDEGEEEEEEEEGATPPNDLWDLREARVQLMLRGAADGAAGEVDGDVDGGASKGAALDRAFVKLGKSLPEEDPADGRKIADRRGKQALLEELGAEIAWLRGDAAAARKRLDASRLLNPDVPRGERLEILLLGTEGKNADLRSKARDWLREHPDDREIDAVYVHAFARDGWWDLAALRLAAWPRRHPSATANLAVLWDEVNAARAKKPLAGSPFAAFGT
jgi:subtilisin family serine protease